MSVIDLDEYKHTLALRQFRRSGTFSKNLPNRISSSAYNSDAIHYNNALGAVYKENVYQDILSYLNNIGSKYLIFGLKGKYRTVSLLFAIHQEYERIRFIKKSERSLYDIYVLNYISERISDIVNDIRYSINYLDSKYLLTNDTRIRCLNNKLKEIVTCLENV